MYRLEKLIDEEFRRRVWSYVGSDRFEYVGVWIDGFDAANNCSDPGKITDLTGFKEWLVVLLDASGNIGWRGAIEEKYGNDKDATHHFFDLFWSFRQDVNENGLKSIFKRHYDYEIENFGTVRNSEYYSRGWNKT